MTRAVASVSLVVDDYDRAIAFFTQALRFVLLEDLALAEGKRWVRMAPAGGAGAALLLAKASNAEQAGHVGNQTGGRVFLFLQTDDFWGDVHHMQAHGVRFAEAPRHEAYGWVVVFLDCCGNKWDLLEAPAAAALSAPPPGFPTAA